MFIIDDSVCVYVLVVLMSVLYVQCLLLFVIICVILWLLCIMFFMLVGMQCVLSVCVFLCSVCMSLQLLNQFLLFMLYVFDMRLLMFSYGNFVCSVLLFISWILVLRLVCSVWFLCSVVLLVGVVRNRQLFLCRLIDGWLLFILSCLLIVCRNLMLNSDILIDSGVENCW